VPDEHQDIEEVEKDNFLRDPTGYINMFFNDFNDEIPIKKVDVKVIE
jgi:hypothetical protein